MIEVGDISRNGPLEINVVFPERIVGIEKEGLACWALGGHKDIITSRPNPSRSSNPIGQLDELDRLDCLGQFAAGACTLVNREAHSRTISGDGDIPASPAAN